MEQGYEGPAAAVYSGDRTLSPVRPSEREPMAETVLNRLGLLHERANGHLNDLATIAERLENFAGKLLGHGPTPPVGGEKGSTLAKAAAMDATRDLQDATERQIVRIRNALGRLGA